MLEREMNDLTNEQLSDISYIVCSMVADWNCFYVE